MLGVEFDHEAKTSFLKMTREEQLMAVLSAQAYLRGEIAKLKKWQIDYENDSRQYRRIRERFEKDHNGDSSVDLTDITEKITEGIQKALAQRFDFWVYLRDKVAPQFISIAVTVIIILMGLFLSGKFPW